MINPEQQSELQTLKKFSEIGVAIPSGKVLSIMSNISSSKNILLSELKYVSSFLHDVFADKNIIVPDDYVFTIPFIRYFIKNTNHINPYNHIKCYCTKCNTLRTWNDILKEYNACLCDTAKEDETQWEEDEPKKRKYTRKADFVPNVDIVPGEKTVFKDFTLKDKVLRNESIGKMIKINIEINDYYLPNGTKKKNTYLIELHKQGMIPYIMEYTAFLNREKNVTIHQRLWHVINSYPKILYRKNTVAKFMPQFDTYIGIQRFTNNHAIEQYVTLGIMDKNYNVLDRYKTNPCNEILIQNELETINPYTDVPSMASDEYNVLQYIIDFLSENNDDYNALFSDKEIANEIKNFCKEKKFTARGRNSHKDKTAFFINNYFKKENEVVQENAVSPVVPKEENNSPEHKIDGITTVTAYETTPLVGSNPIEIGISEVDRKKMTAAMKNKDVVKGDVDKFLSILYGDVILKYGSIHRFDRAIKDHSVGYYKKIIIARSMPLTVDALRSMLKLLQINYSKYLTDEVNEQLKGYYLRPSKAGNVKDIEQYVYELYKACTDKTVLHAVAKNDERIIDYLNGAIPGQGDLKEKIALYIVQAQKRFYDGLHTKMGVFEKEKTAESIKPIPQLAVVNIRQNMSKYQIGQEIWYISNPFSASGIKKYYISNISLTDLKRNLVQYTASLLKEVSPGDIQSVKFNDTDEKVFTTKEEVISYIDQRTQQLKESII